MVIGVLRIDLIFLWIRIRGSTSEKVDPDPTLPHLIFFFLNFVCNFCSFMSLLFMFIKQKSDNFCRVLSEFITIFFCYPDPDPRFLIRPNEVDPGGSGSATLHIRDKTSHCRVRGKNLNKQLQQCHFLIPRTMLL